MKRILVLLGAFVMAIALAVPALAITKGGSLDGDDHPYVGLMIAQDATGAAWRCSGSLIDEETFVTAGHCTYGAVAVWVYMATDLEPDPSVYGYPFSGSLTGTAHTHPDYLDGAFYLYDLGVVKMDAGSEIVLDEYASLPSVGAIDDLGKGRKNATVTAVGYGLQNANKNHTVALRTRMQADLMVVNTEGVAGIGHLKLPDGWLPTNSVLLSGDAAHGGTCFGDSGGPGLVGDTIVAVNSFGLNSNCAGVGGMFRIDRQFEIDWINSL